MGKDGTDQGKSRDASYVAVMAELSDNPTLDLRVESGRPGEVRIDEGSLIARIEGSRIAVESGYWTRLVLEGDRHYIEFVEAEELEVNLEDSEFPD